jgi:2'-5' RNA ligase
MRLFVALDIPEETRKRLRDLTAQLAPVGRDARWVRTEGIHITLKFIGWLEDAKVAEVEQRLANVPQHSAIPIAFRNFGFFPNEKRPRVFYVGIEAGAELAALAGEIETQLEPLKIPKEERAYTPHLTLARFKTNEGLAEMRKILSSIPSHDFGGTRATEFHLYQSVLKSTGAVYTKLATYSFAS